MASKVAARCIALGRAPSVEEVQDFVEETLLEEGFGRVMKLYADYRAERSLHRIGNTTDAELETLFALNNEEVLQENSNKNPVWNSTLRDYMAGMMSKDYCRRKLYPQEIMAAHDEGIIHIHDLDYVAAHITNCELVNLEDMLQNGTVINKTLIEKPHSFMTACNVATQIAAVVASNTFGGQTMSMAHLAPFIDISRKKIIREVEKESEMLRHPYTPEEIRNISNARLLLEVQRGVQTLQYQVNTLFSANGQTPFISFCLDIHEVPEGQIREDLALLIKEIFEQRLIGVKNEAGAWITPTFPKLLYFLNEDNVHSDSKYFWLTELAAKCTAKRMVPDYISEKIMLKCKGDVYPCMGCRAFLTPDPEGHKYYGRFNSGAVTINLPYVACASEGNEERFWELMEEYSEKYIHQALLIRHKRVRGTPSDVAPILWQYGAMARLAKGETIDKLLYNNYSTISYGYGGIAECVYRMLGVSHTTPEGMEFAKKVMTFMNKKCAQWRQEENISYSLYGTPMESLTYRFAKCNQRRFGIIPHVTDKSYITNSYHVHVTEEIDAFSKLSFEAQLQELSPGGSVAYVEVPNMQNNIPAVIAVIRHIYENIMYAELNTKSDHCQVCGFDGEIRVVKDENGKLDWECPRCGNRDHDKMTVVRRTCGYLGSNFWNQGRTQEIQERVMHL